MRSSTVPAGRLPDPDVRPIRDEVIALVLARRGDLAQAAIFADVACLEVEAQGSSLHLRMETFAAGSDIHSSQVPQGVHDNEYRPGAVPPAMPTLLVGSRADRVKRAQSLYARAGAVVEVTHNLIALEADDAFLRWEEASIQVPQTREAADAGDKLADDLSRDYRAGLKVKTDEVVTASALAAQTRANIMSICITSCSPWPIWSALRRAVSVRGWSIPFNRRAPFPNRAAASEATGCLRLPSLAFHLPNHNLSAAGRPVARVVTRSLLIGLSETGAGCGRLISRGAMGLIRPHAV